MILVCSRRMGASAVSFEIEDDPKFQDILSGIGFAYGLAITLRLYMCATYLQSGRPYHLGKHDAPTCLKAGMDWEAPVCSTWVWVNRSLGPTEKRPRVSVCVCACFWVYTCVCKCRCVCVSLCMYRGTSKRSPAFPLGDCSVPAVRMAKLCCIEWAFGIQIARFLITHVGQQSADLACICLI